MRWAALSQRRPSAWFALAAVLATIAAIATVRLASANVPMQEVVVAVEDLAIGTRFGAEDRRLTLRSIPEGGRLDGMFAAPDELIDAQLAVPVGAGEPVTLATVGGHRESTAGPLQAGERAISVPIAAAGAAAALLVPGVRVDVVASGLTAGTEARIVVRDAEVVTRHAVLSGEGGEPADAVLLRVTEHDALKLSAALDVAGGVRLLPRPVSELDPDRAP